MVRIVDGQILPDDDPGNARRQQPNISSMNNIESSESASSMQGDPSMASGMPSFINSANLPKIVGGFLLMVILFSFLGGDSGIYSYSRYQTEYSEENAKKFGLNASSILTLEEYYRLRDEENHLTTGIFILFFVAAFVAGVYFYAKNLELNGRQFFLEPSTSNTNFMGNFPSNPVNSPIPSAPSSRPQGGRGRVHTISDYPNN